MNKLRIHAAQLKNVNTSVDERLHEVKKRFEDEFEDYIDALVEEGISYTVEYVHDANHPDKETQIVLSGNGNKYFFYFSVISKESVWAYELTQPLHRYEKKEFALMVAKYLLDAEPLQITRGFRVTGPNGQVICYVDVPSRELAISYLEKNGCPQPFTVSDERF